MARCLGAGVQTIVPNYARHAQPLIGEDTVAPLPCVEWSPACARHAESAASSRQNDKETILFGVLRLSKRSIEIKPSIRSSSPRSPNTQRPQMTQRRSPLARRSPGQPAPHCTPKHKLALICASLDKSGTSIDNATLMLQLNQPVLPNASINRSKA
jgi:hypothetical protein